MVVCVCAHTCVDWISNGNKISINCPEFTWEMREDTHYRCRTTMKPRAGFQGMWSHLDKEDDIADSLHHFAFYVFHLMVWHPMKMIIFFQFSFWSWFDTDQCLSVSFFMELQHQKLTAGNLNWYSDGKCNDCSQWLILSDLVFNSKVLFYLTVGKKNVVGWWVGQMSQRKPFFGGKNCYGFGSCY